MDVAVSSLTRRYPRPGGGDVIALDGVTATFHAGEVSALVGRSGSGKSTLIRLLAGLEVADSGSVHLGKRLTSELGARERRALRRECVSVIFQDLGLVAEMTVAENITLAMSISGVQTGPESIVDALKVVELEGFEKRFVATLSGGEEQRAAIARSLVLGHPILLADEPTGSLDAENAAMVLAALREVARQGATVIVATHDDVVYDGSDAVWKMVAGTMARR